METKDPAARRVSIIVCALLNILIGLNGILRYQPPVYVSADVPYEFTPFAATGVSQSTVAVLQVLGYIGFALAAVAVAGGVGLIRFKPWGWRLTLFYGYAGFVIGLLSMLLTHNVMSKLLKGMPAPTVSQGLFALVGIVIPLLFLSYLVALVVFLSRPRTRALFESHPNLTEVNVAAADADPQAAIRDDDASHR